MANAEELARELHGLMHHTAKKVDEQPTGVVPGYSTSLGGTVLPNGKIRYVNSSASGAKLVTFHYKNSSQTISTSGTPTVNFDQEVYDPDNLVTTGASWTLTVVTTGWYLVTAKIRFVEIGSGWSSGDYINLMLKKGGTAFEYLDILDDPQNSTLNNVLEASVPFQLDAAEEIAIGLQLSTSGSKDIDGSFQCRCAVYFLNP